MGRIRNHDDFVMKLKSKVGDEYTVIGKYVNSGTKVKVRHNCGFEYEVLSGNILKGRKCPKCQKRVKTKDTEYFKKEIFEWVGDEYSLLGEYKNSSTKTKVKHNRCGYEYESTPNDFQQGKRCPKCAGNLRFNHTEILDIIYNLVGDEYTLMSEYQSINKHVIMKHNKCGHVYKVLAGNFVYRERKCPKCKHSKGETAVAKFLDTHHIPYKTQFYFKDLTSDKGVYLRFDFAIISDDKIKMLIEYDGEFHYELKSHRFNAKSFEEQQKRDAIKNDYCLSHHIPLIRIPYWEFDNIDNVLESAFK